MAYAKYTEDDREAIAQRLWERDHMTCGESPAQAWKRFQSVSGGGARERR